MLASILAGRSLVEDAGFADSRIKSGTASNHAEGDPTADPLAPRRLRWAFFESPTRFKLESMDPKMPGKRVVSILALQGARWKLVDVYYVTPT
jgi:hypothetical protein